MTDYDSDSSLEDKDKDTYRETNVLLGYASKQPTDDTVSHLGGLPTWLDHDSPPPAAFARCKVCNGLLSLLLQLNGDLPSHFPGDERRLHILCCRKKTCSRKPGSIRALREVRKHNRGRPVHMKEEKRATDSSASHDQQQFPDLGATLFGIATPSQTLTKFSTSSSTTPNTANPFAALPPTSTLAAKTPQSLSTSVDPPTDTFASKFRISSPNTAEPNAVNATPSSEPWPPACEFPPPFPHLHLDADYETLSLEEPLPPTTSPSSKQIQYTEDDSTAASGGPEKETFESQLDKTFLRFSDRLSQNPDQALRYEFKGQPLLYSGSDNIAHCFGVVAGRNGRQAIGPVQAMPRCEACGAQRVFELQLVPGAIAALEDEVMELEEGMEWGTIILGVCSKDCGEVGKVVFREEWVGVQWEERVVPK